MSDCTKNIPVGAVLNDSHLLQLLQTVTNDTSGGFAESAGTDTPAIVATEDLGETTDTTAGADVHPAGNGGCGRANVGINI